jgi:hypothetical protein
MAKQKILPKHDKLGQLTWLQLYRHRPSNENARPVTYYTHQPQSVI